MVNLNTTWKKVTELSGPEQLTELILYSIQKHASLNLGNDVRINRVNHYCVMTALEIEHHLAGYTYHQNVNDSGVDVKYTVLITLDGSGSVHLNVRYAYGKDSDPYVLQ